MTTPSLAEVRNKWQSYVPKHYAEWKRDIAFTLIENQDRYMRIRLEELGPSDNWSGSTAQVTLEALEKQIGNDWQDQCLRAIGKTLPRCPLLDFASVQPFQGPVAIVSYLAVGTSTPLRATLQKTEVRAHPRRLGVTLNPHALEASLTEAFVALTREGIGTLLNGAGHRVVVKTDHPLKQLAALKSNQEKITEGIQEAIALIHEKSMRGPGNLLVSSPEHTEICQLLSRRTTHWEDPPFPADQILVAYKGTHPYDAGLIWAPYVFEAEAMSTPPGRPPVIKMRTRGHFRLVSTDRSVVVEIK